MRRITGTMVALSATAMLLAGCGSGTHASSISASVGTDKPISSAQDAAYARAVNLSAPDVPGLQAALHKPRAETTDGPFGAAMGECQSAAVRGGGVFGISSQRFVHLSPPLQSVGSGVYYFKSEALAREYLAAADSPRFAACVNDARLSTLPVSLPVVHTYGLRLAARSPLVARGGAEAYTDFLSFVKVDAVITLTAIGQGHPFPAGSERRLLALLYRRAQAHNA